MIYDPINAITWTIGSVPTTRFGIKALVSSKQSRSPFSNKYGYMAILLGLAFFLLGVPALFTRNTDILKATSFLADISIQTGMQILVWMVWFIGARKYFKLMQLLSITITYSIILLMLELFTSYVKVSTHPNLVLYIDRPIVLALKSFIYLVLALPLGYFFLTQVPKAVGIISKLKAIMTSLVFIIVSVAAASNNIFDKGADTVSSSTTLAIFFTIFLFISFLPSTATRNKYKTKLKGR